MYWLCGKVQRNFGHKDFGKRVGSSMNASFQSELSETCNWTDASNYRHSHALVLECSSVVAGG
jgi:hypothetical protein